MIATILPLVVSILGQLPQALDAARTIWDLATKEEAPTAEEQAAFDAALEEAHQAVQRM